MNRLESKGLEVDSIPERGECQTMSPYLRQAVDKTG